MSNFDHTQFQWQAYKQGNDVWVRPVNPYDGLTAQELIRLPPNKFKNSMSGDYDITYPAPYLEDGKTYEGEKLEPFKQGISLANQTWRIVPNGDEKYFAETRIALRLKQPYTPTSEGKGETVDSQTLIAICGTSFNGYKNELLRNGQDISDINEQSFNAGFLNGFYSR